MVATMGRYAAREEIPEEERERQEKDAREKHWRNMLYAGIE